jgi:hypothetical protein
MGGPLLHDFLFGLQQHFSQGQACAGGSSLASHWPKASCVYAHEPQRQRGGAAADGCSSMPSPQPRPLPAVPTPCCGSLHPICGFLRLCRA